jgi:hypothetical protein
MYTVEVYARYGNNRSDTSILILHKSSSLTDAKKACLSYARNNSSMFYKIVKSDDKMKHSGLWFIARKVPFGNSRELIELEVEPTAYPNALDLKKNEIKNLSEEVEALKKTNESLRQRLEAALKENESLKSHGSNQPSYSNNNRNNDYRDAYCNSSASYGGSSAYSGGREYLPNGNYRERRGHQGTVAEYRPDGSQRTGFDSDS